MGYLISYIALAIGAIASLITIKDYIERKKKRRSSMNSKRRFD